MYVKYYVYLSKDVTEIKSSCGNMRKGLAANKLSRNPSPGSIEKLHDSGEETVASVGNYAKRLAIF